ncbi:MAG: thermonuclease family protein, partial [Kiritimatiellae bacterium]|nr:thermonuclease family protein [Kiritimatiellia bacterium]
MRNVKLLLCLLILAGAAPDWLFAQKGGEWKVLENCTYVPNDSANDGDSFWLQHKRKKMKIRLYFVDCPESTDDEAWAEGRLDDQAEYFNSDAEGMLRTGLQAKKFAQKILSGKDGFTVYTKMQTAMGRGKTRYYAMVEVDGRFLSEWLTENGLVRINKRTMISGLLPNKMSVDKYEHHLRKLEQQAKRDELGGWGRQVGRARNKVAKILEERGEAQPSEPQIPTGIVVLK